MQRRGLVAGVVKAVLGEGKGVKSPALSGVLGDAESIDNLLASGVGLNCVVAVVVLIGAIGRRRRGPEVMSHRGDRRGAEPGQVRSIR